jgi:rfaE bifunctional protein nucleotidyltransferase chain/domain
MTASGSKIVTIGDMARKAVDLRSKKSKIVFTNGCFDILHAGHVEYLAKARAMGNILIVGLNSDGSVRKIKGKHRPINNQADRAKVLASLECVDFVTIFEDKTPEKVIRKIRPDVLAKGGDWKKTDVAGNAFVESLGGKVAIIPFAKGYSTTSIIKKMTGQKG